MCYSSDYTPCDKSAYHYRARKIMKDWEQCMLCGSSKHLHVHHINGDYKDNSEFNLFKVCVKCHENIHRTKRGF